MPPKSLLFFYFTLCGLLHLISRSREFYLRCVCVCEASRPRPKREKKREIKRLSSYFVVVASLLFLRFFFVLFCSSTSSSRRVLLLRKGGPSERSTARISRAMRPSFNFCAPSREIQRQEKTVCWHSSLFLSLSLAPARELP